MANFGGYISYPPRLHHHSEKARVIRGLFCVDGIDRPHIRKRRRLATPPFRQTVKS
jgi:hypothetical protein